MKTTQEDGVVMKEPAVKASFSEVEKPFATAAHADSAVELQEAPGEKLQEDGRDVRNVSTPLQLKEGGPAGKCGGKGEMPKYLTVLLYFCSPTPA